MIRTLRVLTNQLLDTKKIVGVNKGVRAVKRAAYVYNRQVHSSIGATPLEADDMKAAGRVLRYVLDRRRATDVPRRSPSFRVGQSVRLRLKKMGRFSKSGEPKYGPPVYKVDRLEPSEPVPSYRLIDIRTGRPLKGSYAETDMLSAK